MDILQQMKCPKCSDPMMQGTTRGVFTGRRNDGLIDKTETIKYMCTSCGYVEERAENPLFWEKIK